MSNEKHTPGPWFVESKMDYRYGKTALEIVSEANGGTEIGRVYPGCDDNEKKECLANARLIAAAPELLAACEVAYHVLKTTEAENYPETIGMLFEAISKAKGEK